MLLSIVRLWMVSLFLVGVAVIGSIILFGRPVLAQPPTVNLVVLYNRAGIRLLEVQPVGWNEDAHTFSTISGVRFLDVLDDDVQLCVDEARGCRPLGWLREQILGPER